MIRFLIILACCLTPPLLADELAVPVWMRASSTEDRTIAEGCSVAEPEFLQKAAPQATQLPFGEEPIRMFKTQAIQKITASGGWLSSTKADDVSTGFFKTSIGLGIPLGSLDNIVVATPSFRVDWIDANIGIDVPTEVFETGVSFFYRRPINDRLSLMAIVAPSVRSDFTTSDNALRIFGLGLLNWECVPERLSVAAGAVFLDRADVPLLPAIGLTWTPRTTTRLDLRFPESRLNWRIQKNGAESETWTYTSAGLGGNTWAVTRANGQTDEFSLRDIRLMLGIEHITDGGGGWFIESGLALNRRVEYEVTNTDIRVSNGVVLQAGWSY